MRGGGLCGLLVLAIAGPGVHAAEGRPLRALQQERAARAERAWRAEWAGAPQRPRRQRCDAASGACVFAGLQAALVDGEGLVFCKDCVDPHGDGGAWLDTWECAYRPRGYHVDGEIVLSVPNDASTPLLNPVGGAIALAYRGGVAFHTKAVHAQQAGAGALVIVDDGTCGDAFSCGGWLGSRADGDMAARDDRAVWAGVRIPVVLVSRRQGERLVRQLGAAEVEIEGLGTQLVVE